MIARPNPSDEQIHGWALRLIDRSTGSDRIKILLRTSWSYHAVVPASCLALRFSVLFLDSVRSIIDASAYYPNLHVMLARGKK